MRVLFFGVNERNKLLFRTSLEKMRHAVTVLDEVNFDFEYIKVYEFDLILLDLPRFYENEDDLKLIAKCSALCRGAGVLVLSDSGDSESRLIALEHGADDCLVGPPNMRKFEIILKSLEKRYGGIFSPVVKAGPIKLSRSTCSAKLENRDIKLTPKEYILLELLIKQAGRIVATDLIMSHIFDLRECCSTNLIHPHISRLRSKFKDTAINITAVYGIGYKLDYVNEAEI